MRLSTRIWNYIVGKNSNSSSSGIYIYNPAWDCILLFFRMQLYSVFAYIYQLFFIIFGIICAIIGFPFGFIFRLVLVGLGDFAWIMLFFIYPVSLILGCIAMRYFHRYVMNRFFDDE